MSPKLSRTLFILTFIISTILRLGLTLVNREANDPHDEVFAYILQHGSLPTKDDCWECFQPKLYHVLITGIIKAGHLTDPDAQILAANFFSFTAGLLTILVIWRFLTQLPVQNELLRWLAFAYVALNPKLIGISSQGTNDALLILFSTLALVQGWWFLQSLDTQSATRTEKTNSVSQTLLHFSLLTIFAILSASTKTNGWVTFVIILVALLIRAMLDSKNRLRIETYVLAYLVIVPLLVTLNPLNQYISNYQKYGAPVLVNINKMPTPPLFEQRVAARPGILSIQDGFFTFKFINLLKYPYINSQRTYFFEHRTSLWTQLYARAHSVNFDNWPGSWRSDNPAGFPQRRAIFILALLPSGLILAGAVMHSLALLKALRQKDLPAAQGIRDGLPILAFLGYVGFVTLYTFMYRDYPVMKAVFTYPALIAFPVLFISAAQKLPDWAFKALAALSVALFALYIADVLSLIIRL